MAAHTRTPVPRPAYRLGAPADATYRVVLNSDAPQFGGSGFPVPAAARADAVPYHGFEQSLTVSLPPLSMLVLVPDALPEEVPAAPVVADESLPKKKTKKDKKQKAPKAPKPPKRPKPAKLPTTAKPTKTSKPGTSEVVAEAVAEAAQPAKPVARRTASKTPAAAGAPRSRKAPASGTGAKGGDATPARKPATRRRPAPPAVEG